MGAGLIGFLVVLGLVVASFLLFRSMSRHLRKVPDSFESPAPDPRSAPTGGSTTAPAEPTPDEPSGDR